MYEDRVRWYHVYLHMMAITGIITLVMSIMTGWSTGPIIISCGMMSIMCFIVFVAEFTVMGATANAGGAFFTAATCFLIAHYVPFPVIG